MPERTMTSSSDVSETHLVLDGRKRRVMAALFGRAVAATPDGGLRQLMPIQRISHVTVHGQVTLDAALLVACANSGRPVGMADADGRLRALVVPMGVRRTPLADALDRLGRRRDWAERLDDWRRSRLSWIARGIVDDPAGAARAGWAGAEALIVAAAGAGTRGRATRLANLARTHSMLVAARVLGDGGCPTRWMTGAADHRHDLVPVFGQIALWRLARLSVRSRGAGRLRHALARDLERSGRPDRALEDTATLVDPPLRRALAGEIGHLHSWLVDITGPFSDWHFPEGRGGR